MNGTKSWVDGGRYYLTELKNASVYIFDVVSHAAVGRVPGFTTTLNADGTVNGTRSGPNSITFSGGGHAWVSDGNSNVRVVDLSSMSFVATVSTAIAACDNGTVHNCQRTNEITYDPEHGIIFVQNPSPLSVTTGAAIDTYGTFIDAATFAVLGTITFTNRRGQEAPLWDSDQHRILTAVSGRQVVAGGVVTALFHQYVAVIDPTVRPFTVEHEYDIDCTALGLADAVTAANPTGRRFGINDPSLGADGHLVIPGCSRALIMDARTGAIVAVRREIGGGNETWYNSGDGNFYVTGIDSSRTTPVNSLGVIDARSTSLLQTVPAVAATNPAAAAENNEIFAVVPGNTTATTACTAFGFQASGCILVFAHVPGAAN